MPTDLILKAYCISFQSQHSTSCRYIITHISHSSYQLKSLGMNGVLQKWQKVANVLRGTWAEAWQPHWKSQREVRGADDNLRNYSSLFHLPRNPAAGPPLLSHSRAVCSLLSLSLSLSLSLALKNVCFHSLSTLLTVSAQFKSIQLNSVQSNSNR